MQYLFARVKSMVRHLAGPRGALLVVAVAGGLVAFFVSRWLAVVCYVVAAAALSGLVLLLSLRQSEDHAKVLAAREKLRKLARSAKTPIASEERVGPSDATIRAERVEHARRALLEVRSAAVTAKASSVADRLAPAEPKPEIDTGLPAVTVVVPCHNEERFLGAALESIRRQSFDDWECIIVDDASTDRSVKEAWRYVKLDKRFRLIRHKVNGGLSAARNTGLRAARGRLTAFLDADDLLLSDSLLDRVEALGAGDSSVVGSYCGIRSVPEEIELDGLAPHEDWKSGGIVDFVSSRAECPFSVHAPLVLTSVVRGVGGFDESMRHGAEDWDLWLRLMRRGHVFVPARWTTAIYRQKRSSMAKALAVEHLTQAERLVASCYEEDQAALAGPRADVPFPEPLHTYQRRLVLARRTVLFGAMTLLRGGRDAARSALQSLGEVPYPLLARHVDVADLTRKGFCRVLGLNLDEYDEIAADIEPLRHEFASLIEEACGAAGGGEPMAAAGPHFDVVFMPQTPHQAKAMVDLEARVRDRLSTCFVLVDRIEGNQGTTAVVAEAGVEQFSVNEWVLGGMCLATLVVASPHSATIEEMAARTASSGGEVVELALEGDDVVRVDEYPAATYPLSHVTPDHAVEILTTDDRAGAFVEVVARTRPGPMLWATHSGQDGDTAYAVEEYPHTVFDSTDLERFHDLHAGERCVVVGNGPSLNVLDLAKLEGEYTIAVNGIFYAADRMGFDPSYYVVEDTAFMSDNVEAIKAYPAGHKFFPSIYRDQIGDRPGVSYFMMNRGYYEPTSPSYCVPRFSADIAQRIYSGQSVTIINLQLAYFLGFSEVILIGMDFSYTVPADAKVDGVIITSMSDDPNHFHPDYFGKGKVWKDPKVDRVLANYQLAKLTFEADGRRIVNATAGGKLELFERVSYDRLFG